MVRVLGEPQALADGGQTIDETLLHHLSSLGWEHINLTGDYVWAAEQADRKSSISGPCAEGQTLSVLYNPNSLVTPILVISIHADLKVNNIMASPAA
jgi:hypothetical protein